MYRDLVKEVPADGLLHHDIAALSWRAGDHWEAIRHWQRAVRYQQEFYYTLLGTRTPVDWNDVYLECLSGVSWRVLPTRRVNLNMTITMEV